MTPWPRRVSPAIMLDDVLALLEDGPKRAADLAAWLDVSRWEMTQTLTRFAAAGVVALAGRGKAARWSLPGSDRRFDACRDAPISRSGTTRHTDRTSVVEHADRSVRRVEDEEFEIVWNGVGPLPGSGEAAGLGSTLSGRHFGVHKP